MRRCFELAAKGLGNVAPNPMVGAVVVHEGKIIGEGFHTAFGKPHAEVEAIHSVVNKELLSNSELYVSLEPCNHSGKTPPCTDLILSSGIKKVIVSTTDPNPKVNGSGIEKLRNSGVEVISNVLEEEGKILNRRFFTFHTKKRPYIILKWAQTNDGFIDKLRSEAETGSFTISGQAAQLLNHSWRSEEQAILIGATTAQIDQPQLTTRKVSGKSPLRVLIDPNLRVSKTQKLFTDDEPLLIFNRMETRTMFQKTWIQLDFSVPVLPQILDYLHYLSVQSLIVEGGAHTLQQFIDSNLWDEARIITSTQWLGSGLKAPIFNNKPAYIEACGNDAISFFFNSNL